LLVVDRDFPEGKKMKPVAFAAACAFLLALPLAHAAGKMSGEDETALKKLAQDDLAEIAAGTMAQERATSPEVKTFGAEMAKDHGRMLEEKKRMAKAKGVTLPTAPDAGQKAEAQKLQSMAKQDFDREYMGHMVRDHADDLALVQKTARGAQDPQLKAAAGKAAPVIGRNLETAKSVQAGLR
jgi:putative membrane protein